MKSVLVLAALVLSAVSFSIAQRSKVVTTTTRDPASVTLEDLFKQADLVAFIEVRAGDLENYDQVVYKARIVKGYKGAAANETIYFGPFISYGIGSEYLVFLRRASTTVGELATPSSRNKPLLFESNYPIYSVMYEGYSVMPVSFECVFEEPRHQSCDYGVRINSKQVKTPPSLTMFPERSGLSEFTDNRFLKRKSLESLLEKLHSRGG